jgi:pimeloyl-ACP methyl ester carboxylesterase
MTDIILVPGAWHGGWVWERLIGHLPNDRTRAVAVDLPATSGGEPATLADHAAHLHAVIAEADDDVVVVAHSYSGLVVQQALAVGSLRPSHVIFLDAWLGSDGDSMFSLAPEPVAEFWRASIVDDHLPPPAPELVGITDAVHAAWLAARLTPQPLRTFTDPIRLHGHWLPCPATAVVCEPATIIPFASWARAQRLPVVPLRSGHNAMVTVPAELADVIVTASGF